MSNEYELPAAGEGFNLDSGAFDLGASGFELEPPPDVLEDVPLTDNPEQNGKVEMGAMLKAFKERNRKEVEYKRMALDSEYWVALCFQTRAQKEAFLRAMKWLELGDKYLDGGLIAKRLGIPLPEAHLTFHDTQARDPYTKLIPTIRGLPKKNPPPVSTRKPAKRRKGGDK